MRKVENLLPFICRVDESANSPIALSSDYDCHWYLFHWMEMRREKRTTTTRRWWCQSSRWHEYHAFMNMSSSDELLPRRWRWRWLLQFEERDTKFSSALYLFPLFSCVSNAGRMNSQPTRRTDEYSDPHSLHPFLRGQVSQLRDVNDYESGARDDKIFRRISYSPANAIQLFTSKIHITRRRWWSGEGREKTASSIPIHVCREGGSEMFGYRAERRIKGLGE